ncbi:hypothetical protein QC762_704980 [Podospora pseudocomata]|uniref:4Fe-4S ferredoxin-type domain-containing protein n=1 Tax=Podospora pseudocomata TaxID=2093779 RepID=A0ABR0G225_9PEZI|nr:hypothetical protein QC762_704980 [Podospora pseudocomata]
MDDQPGSCYVRTAVIENKFDRRRGGRLRRKWQEPRRCFDSGIPNVNSSALLEEIFFLVCLSRLVPSLASDPGNCPGCQGLCRDQAVVCAKMTFEELFV